MPPHTKTLRAWCVHRALAILPCAETFFIIETIRIGKNRILDHFVLGSNTMSRNNSTQKLKLLSGDPWIVLL